MRVRARAHGAVRRLPLGQPGAAVRRLLTLALAAVLPLSIAAAGNAVTGKPATGRPVTSHLVTAHRTVVSFTFDDGDADQMTAARILRSYGMRGTFYIITGAVGTPGYVTLADLHQLAAAGNEIGGHTVSHLELTHVSTAEARRQVCTGRDILTRWGFRVTSFAYPGAATARRWRPSSADADSPAPASRPACARPAAPAVPSPRPERQIAQP